LKIAEVQYIQKFKANNKNFGYNMTPGGDGVYPSEEMKEKISNTLKGRKLTIQHCINISQGKKGVPLSEEHKRKMREVNVGRVHTKEARKNMSLAHIGKQLPKRSTEAKLKASVSGKKDWECRKQKKQYNDIIYLFYILYNIIQEATNDACNNNDGNS
jgi:hypothetical protein